MSRNWRSWPGERIEHARRVDWALARFGWQQDFDDFRTGFDEASCLAIIAVGIIPVPFQMAMLTAASGIRVWPF
ncbi:MAG: hypothetical protein AAFO01_14475 [Pseudomonadota bacterium]